MARPLILVLGNVFILARLFVLLRPNSSAAGPQTREFDLRISEGVMEPSDIAVAEGDRVVLRILTDSPSKCTCVRLRSRAGARAGGTGQALVRGRSHRAL